MRPSFFYSFGCRYQGPLKPFGAVRTKFARRYDRRLWRSCPSARRSRAGVEPEVGQSIEKRHAAPCGWSAAALRANRREELWSQGWCLLFGWRNRHKSRDHQGMSGAGLPAVLRWTLRSQWDE